VTPTRLRAFAAVVRRGSVQEAGTDLGVSAAAISLHVAALRRQLADQLFVRTSTGLAFTPGGLRLANRAAEMLGLQDRTILEVSQAGAGRRLLRVTGARTLEQPVQQALMCVATLFMLVVAGLSAWAPVRIATDGMAPDMAMGGQVCHDLAGSSPVVVTSLVLVVLLGLVAAQHARRLRLMVASRRTWPPRSTADLPARSGGLLLAPGLSLGGQLAMSGTMIYMLVLMT
jgi:DNA-binding transcriptional LysR family regulator